MQEVKAFRTKDGKVFSRSDHAIHHEQRLKLSEWMDDAGICRGGEWDADMVMDAMLNDAGDLGLILRSIFENSPD